LHRIVAVKAPAAELRFSCEYDVECRLETCVHCCDSSR